LDWQDAEVEIALDEVDGLGTFAELEVAVDADNVETAKSRILSLGDEVGLLNAERRSYLELLIEAGG
jgi:predicted adenylyl cyclase CyaB